MTYRLVRFPSGRDVGMTGIGDPASRQLAVFFHPTPGASGFDPDPVTTARSDLHVLTFDRPGYGATEPDHIGVDTWVDDLAGYLRSAEISANEATGTEYGRVGVIGWREGGIFAAALATRHPRLINRLALIGVPSPSRVGGASRRELVDRQSQIAKFTSPANDPGYESRLERMHDSALIHGGIGVEADMDAYGQLSGEPLQTDVPALILYGAMDDYATVQDAKWYAAGIPNAQVEKVESAVDPMLDRWEMVLRFVRGRENA